MADVEEIIKEAVENVTESATAKKVSTPEGMAVAYGSLVIMAMLPIFFGALRSVKQMKNTKMIYSRVASTSVINKNGDVVQTYNLQDIIDNMRASGQKPETMTSKDAMMFPIIASGALFGLYMVFKIFSKDYINLLLTGYFFFLGVLALSHLLSPVIGSLIPTSIPNIPFHIKFTQGEDKKKEDLIDYKFSSHDIICLIISIIIGVWYLFKKHWIANNLLGIAFAVNGVELLHLNNIVTGVILLSGLFFYDIFWVFGTNVMVTVAKNFEAPIKLIFPQDIIVNGLNASNFAMLGLGDIVIPGIFIALLLRFDHSLKRKTKTYFYATLISYFLGLLTTILVMHFFKHAQPALLYLVPLCLGTPLLLALIKGDLKVLFSYEDNPTEKTKPKKSKEVTANGGGVGGSDESSNEKKESKKQKVAKKVK